MFSTGLDSPIDVIFSFDATGGQSADDPQMAKRFLQGLLQSYDVSSTNIGLVTYSSTASETMPLVFKPSKEAVMKSVENLPTEAGPRIASNALVLARRSLLNFPASDLRGNVSHQVVLFTLGDNDASDKTNFAMISKQLQKDNITLIVLAVNTARDMNFADAVKNSNDFVKSPNGKKLRSKLGILEERSGNAAGLLI